MEFAQQFKDLIESGELEEASNQLYDVVNIMEIGEASWDLSSILSAFIAKAEDQKSVDFVRNAAMYLCQLFGSPKELFLVYLENAEGFFGTLDKYSLLVDLLQTLLLRLSARFVFYSLELALNQLIKPISRKTAQLVAEKSEQTELDLMKFTGKYVDFLEAFVLSESVNDYKDLLTHALVNLFNEPFLSVDFSVDDNMNFKLDDKSTLEDKKSSYNLIRRIFVLLQTKLAYDNFFTLVQNLEFKCLANDPTVTYKLNKNALCSFIVYSFTQDFNLDRVHSPRVYDYFFLLKSFLPIINFMLSQPTHEQCLDKGVHTLNYFLERIEPMSLEGDLLELMPVVQTFQLLFRVSTYSTKESLRKKTVDTLKAFFNKFTRLGRYTVLNYYLHDNSKDQTLNNYVSSYLIYLFKEEVANTLDQNETFYKCANFKRMFKLIVHMRLGNKTDLMQESSKTNAILNMLRFMLIRDAKNETHIFDLLAEAKYLEELKTAVQFSREHYEQQKKNLIGIQKNDTSIKFEASTLDNEKLAEATTEDKIGSCASALQALDLIEALRCRVVELLEAQQQQQQKA